MMMIMIMMIMIMMMMMKGRITSLRYTWYKHSSSSNNNNNKKERRRQQRKSQEVLVSFLGVTVSLKKKGRSTWESFSNICYAKLAQKFERVGGRSAFENKLNHNESVKSSKVGGMEKKEKRWSRVQGWVSVSAFEILDFPSAFVCFSLSACSSITIESNFICFFFFLFSSWKLCQSTTSAKALLPSLLFQHSTNSNLRSIIAEDKRASVIWIREDWSRSKRLLELTEACSQAEDQAKGALSRDRTKNGSTISAKWRMWER